MFTHSTRVVSLAIGLAMLAACAEVEPTAPVDSQTQAQLSGGPGISVFNFVINSERVGTVMVTDGVSGGGYADQYEFWQWDPDATEAIRDGDISDFTIKVAWRDDKWTQTAADIFEAGTAGWVGFAIPREFELQTQPRWAWSHTPSERFVYKLTAPAWGEAGGTIRYYLEMDFQPNSDIPSMEWLVDADDLKTYYASEDSDEDADEGNGNGNGNGNWTVPPEAQEDITRWEVRLTDDAVLESVGLAWAYELTTVYPPQ